MAERVPEIETLQSESELHLPQFDRTETSGPIEGDRIDVAGIGPLLVVETMTDGKGRKRADQLVLQDQTQAKLINRSPVWARYADRSFTASHPAIRLGEEHLHPLGADLAKQFAILLERNPWTWVAPTLFALARRWGYDLWIVGGAVRDVLGGDGVEAVNDLDLCGTVPPVLFASWLRSLTDLDPVTKADGDGQPYALFKVAQSSNDIVHWNRSGKSIVQYTCLRRRHGGDSWFGGAEFGEDLTFRDVRLNTLFYDPTRHLVIDPSGEGLADLGVAIRGGSVVFIGDVRVVPIDIPLGAPWDWPLKAVARNAKAVIKAKRRSGIVDVAPVSAWFDDKRNRSSILAAYAQDLGPRILGYHMSVAFGSLTQDEADEIYQQVFGTIPDWFQAQVKHGLRAPIAHMGGEDESSGTDLIRLEGDTPPFSLGGPMFEASVLVPPHSILRNSERSVLEVVVGEDVVQVRGVVDGSGFRFAELDDTGSLIIV